MIGLIGAVGRIGAVGGARYVPPVLPVGGPDFTLSNASVSTAWGVVAVGQLLPVNAPAGSFFVLVEGTAASGDESGLAGGERLMAIQVSGSYSSSNFASEDLRLASPVLKRNYTTAITIGGAAGQVVGHWRAVWVRLPATWSSNGRPALLGFDGAGTATFSGGGDTVLRIPQDSYSAVPAIQRRIQLAYAATPAGQVYTGTEGNVAGISQFGLLTPTLIIDGVVNIGSNASPVWRNFVAVCPAGGTPETYVAPTAAVAGWLSSTTGRLAHQYFVAQSTASARTPAAVAMEHAALITGDFPWDTANNPTAGATGIGRPHPDALRALAGSGPNPFLTYQGLVDGMNAGTLPYANLRSNGDSVNPRPGRADVSYWWTLKDLATGLANSGSASAAALTLTAQATNNFPLQDIASIAPSHWAGATVPPAIAVPLVRFTGGRGTLPVVRAGTYDVVKTTALQRRWIYGTSPVNSGASAGAVVPGFDWSTTGITMASGAFTCTTALPVGGPYTLQIRDAADTAVEAAPLTDNIVGTRILMHGQSAMALSVRTGFGATPLGPNLVGASVASGALGAVMRLDNMYGEGGPGGSYAPPNPVVGLLRSGDTPAVGHGAVLFLNEWHANNPGHPLMICNMAINTHGMDQWTANEVIPDGDPSWRFMGPATPTPPGAANGNDSGVVSYFAWLLGSQIDLHMLMWSPGLSETGAGRAAYVAAIDARFGQSAAAPWLIFPPWRFHRSNPDTNAGPAVRDRHVQFVGELGPRGLLGPVWNDISNDGNGSGHPAFNTSMGVPDATQNVSDGNHVGQGRLGRGFGRALAWAFDRRVKAHGPRIIGAWFEDATRTKIHIELGRTVRTVNGAALYAGAYWVSTDNGNTFINTGFTAALSPDGTRVVLTTTGAAWPASNVRVEIHWFMPFGPDEMAIESNAEASLYGLPCDNQIHRGGINLAADVRMGNPLEGTCRAGAGLAGVPVTTRGAARLVASERFTGTRTVTVRLMASDGVTVLREKALAITAS